jgi:hypothetical protein
MSTKWSKSDEEGVYQGRDRATGELKWTATSVDLIFGSNAELRAVAEVYAQADGDEQLVQDFVDAILSRSAIALINNCPGSVDSALDRGQHLAGVFLGFHRRPDLLDRPLRIDQERHTVRLAKARVPLRSRVSGCAQADPASRVRASAGSTLSTAGCLMSPSNVASMYPCRWARAAR